MAIPAVSLSQNPIRNQFAGLDTPVMREDQLGAIVGTYKAMEAEKRALADAELQRQREAERFALEKQMEARRQEALNLEISEARRRQLEAERNEMIRNQTAEGQNIRFTGANVQVPVPQAQPLWEQPQNFGDIQAKYAPQQYLEQGQGMLLGDPIRPTAPRPTWDETGGALLDQSTWTGRANQFIRPNEFTGQQLGDVMINQGVTNPIARATVLGDLDKTLVERKTREDKLASDQREQEYKQADMENKSKTANATAAYYNTFTDEKAAKIAMENLTLEQIQNFPQTVASLPEGGVTMVGEQAYQKIKGQLEKVGSGTTKDGKIVPTINYGNSTLPIYTTKKAFDDGMGNKSSFDEYETVIETVDVEGNPVTKTLTARAPEALQRMAEIEQKREEAIRTKLNNQQPTPVVKTEAVRLPMTETLKGLGLENIKQPDSPDYPALIDAVGLVTERKILQNKLAPYKELIKEGKAGSFVNNLLNDLNKVDSALVDVKSQTGLTNEQLNELSTQLANIETPAFGSAGALFGIGQSVRSQQEKLIKDYLNSLKSE